MKEQVRGTVEMTAAMTILGTIGWFVVMSDRPALDVVFWRCVFGAATLLLICAGMGLLRGLLNIRMLGWAALGGVAIVTNWFMLFQSYSMASISVSTAVYNTQPFMLVLFGAIFFGEKLTLNKFAWLGIAFGGLLLIIAGKPTGGFTGSDYAGGILMALGAAFFWATAAIITKKLKGTPPHLIALIQVCVGILMLIPFADLHNLPDSVQSWGSLVTVGVVHTGIMYVLMYGAVQKLPTHLQGSLSFIYPVVAIIVDLIAFGYRPDVGQIIGAVAILIAAAGMNLGWQLIRPRVSKHLVS
ncbi:MAG: DMT family transporter [Rhodospirillales bacterium]|nr:DMT family transporter [Rhodospirillales bacterium]